MPKSAKRKRSRSRSEDFKSLAKKLKQFLDSVEDSPESEQSKEEQPRHRRRIRVLESSSREPSPSSKNNQDEDNVESQDVKDTRQPDKSSSNNHHQTSLADILEAGPSTGAAREPPLDDDASPDAPSEDHLDDAVLQILGDDPTSTVAYGQEIHKELANRFEHVATTGLAKELRKELCEKYLVPSNCTRIGAPQLNAEIKAALNETLVKRDKSIEARQKQIASVISCIAQIATDQILSKDTKHDVLKKAMDAGRLLADIQYAESTTRRNFATFALKKEMKEHLFNTKIDKYLFGESLPDALKTAKAVTKTSTDLKVDAKKKQRPTASATSKPVSNNLNWKPQAPARRQPEPPRTRQQPAATRAPPSASFKPSSRPPRRR